MASTEKSFLEIVWQVLLACALSEQVQVQVLYCFKFHNLSALYRKEGNVLVNDALNTFYLRLYGVRHMGKDHSDRERKPAVATWANISY